ncbi:short-chain specific acyl-coa dehydrogenase [Luminiphilus syltensis NOR5-1B]|uniref:Short-chain specific acyl-coa dehydrogenase n=1 Tax=Luminiphilus syltensis NOR5-1B TaxID=565045 RepID=B8KTA3_9GAMM|nr:acyl-CoA dehydrogenase family protein [Luminiphilus syltensis]EED34268.1 short-chain specific acyl-coa dehydrogenase [Luminiphilus syltensis NOR5-1B]
MSDQSYLGWPFFDAEHATLVQTLDEWAKAHLPQLTAHEHEDLDGTCRRLVTALGEAGFTRYAVPAGAGGVYEKLNVRSLCLIRETLARHNALADFAFAMQGLGSGPISLFGTEQQQQDYLADVAEGSKISAFALSEPNAGSDVAAMECRAEAEGDGFILNGTKTWISNAGIADFYTVFARTDPTLEGAKGISCFIVPADTPGFEVSERIDLVAPHPLGTLQFTDCYLPAKQLVGEQGRGFAIAMATLDVFRSTVAAAALGMARCALDATLDHIGQRDIFGGKLVDLPLVQAKVGDMALAIDSSALLVYRAAWTKDCVAERVTREAAMAKLAATESAQQVIDSAVQLHGGKGVTKGNIVESLYRDIRALRIYEGASEVQQTIIARQAIDQHKG